MEAQGNQITEAESRMWLPGVRIQWGVPGSSVVKNLPASAGDKGLIPGSGRPRAGGNGNSLQFSWLENPADRGAW